jgi:hypothetical protein
MSFLRPFLLACVLLFGASANLSQAQEAAPPGEESAGSPLPGYIATGCFCAAAIFVLCKSARR